MLAEIGKQTQGRRTDLLSTIDKRLEPDSVLSIVDKAKPHDTRKEIAEKIGWSTGKVGYANVMTYPQNTKYQDRFLKALQGAREGKKGFWR